MLQELTAQELDAVTGGVNGGEVADGALAFLGATLAIGLAPKEALGAIAVGAYWGISAVSGYVIGEGLVKPD